jgi:hypothetical protein
MKNIDPTLKDIATYAAKFGRKGKAEIEVLNEAIPYLEATILESPGKEIFIEDSDRCVELMKKSYQSDLPIEERVELKYLRNRLDRIVNKLNEFYSTQRRVMEGIGRLP